MTRPRFQFGLRTLLVATAVAGVGCWYVADEGQVVAERKNALRDCGGMFGGSCTDKSGVTYTASVPWIRRLLGDSGVAIIILGSQVSDDAVARLKELFPEAHLIHRNYCGFGADRSAGTHADSAPSNTGQDR